MGSLCLKKDGSTGLSRQFKSNNEVNDKNDRNKTDNEFVHKRKRFRELIRLQLIRGRTTRYLTHELNSWREAEMNLMSINLNEAEKKENADYHVAQESKSESIVTINDSTKSISHSNSLASSSSQRPNEAIRNKYYANLITKGYWFRDTYREQTHCQSIFIFDWDDTIMCTTHLIPNGNYLQGNISQLVSESDMKIFNTLEIYISKMLQYALNRGRVFIVTNAASGWIEFSSKLFYPTISGLLEKIIIISSRSWFEKEYPGDSRMWKIGCFQELGKIFNCKVPTNLIAVGDSFIEMEAAYSFASNYKQCFIKTVKLRDSPTLKQMLKQLELIYSELPGIVCLQQSTTISVQKLKRSNSVAINRETNCVKNRLTTIAKDLKQTTKTFK